MEKSRGPLPSQVSLPFTLTLVGRLTQSSRGVWHVVDNVMTGVRFGYFKAKCGLDTHYTFDGQAGTLCRRCKKSGTG